MPAAESPYELINVFSPWRGLHLSAYPHAFVLGVTLINVFSPWRGLHN
jgi:hypothetical protein